MDKPIRINKSNIAHVIFDDDVVVNIKKQITTIPTIDSNGEIESLKLEYGIQFHVNGTNLNHVINMASLNSKTDIGNNFRARAKKDVDDMHNDTFDYFNTMLNDDNVLIVGGFPTALPDVPETPEQKKRTIVKQYNTMDVAERKQLISELQSLNK